MCVSVSLLGQNTKYQGLRARVKGGRQASKAGAGLPTKVGTVLRNSLDWLDKEWHFLIILFLHGKCAPCCSIFKQKCMHVYARVCANTTFMTVEKSETLSAVYIDVVSEVECQPQYTCAQKIMRCRTVMCFIHCSTGQLMSHPDQHHPKQCTQAASASGSVVWRVMCIIIRCSICFALSS